jgi:hypothetical protein
MANRGKCKVHAVHRERCSVARLARNMSVQTRDLRTVSYSLRKRLVVLTWGPFGEQPVEDSLGCRTKVRWVFFDTFL